ncbi:phosphotransferase [Vibrio astriarenae]
MKNNYLKHLHSLNIEVESPVTSLQTLWSGYGELLRVKVRNYPHSSLIVKHVISPKHISHPKGWSSNNSHKRKLRSYNIEAAWYQNFTESQDNRCTIPCSLLTHRKNNQWIIIMEDLACFGFTQTANSPTKKQLSASLYWLANFHAKYIGNEGAGLWESGTYWHLETRPDELEALDDLPLKSAAKEIDNALKKTPFQTLVHGDAKLANFCFTESGDKAAAVDFQYVGKGCAMKDVALFMSSAVEPEHCSKMESWILDDYFHHLHQAIAHYQPTLSPNEVEQAWRPMFAIAWADFQRFVKGWSPNHWKINTYTESLKERALEQLARRDN